MHATKPFGQLAVLGAAALVSLGSLGQAAAADVNIYTTREPGLIKPLLDTFSKETGIKVNAIFVQTGLTERVKAEGPNSPADLLITVDFGNLIEAVDAGVTQKLENAKLAAAVPSNLRAPDGSWYALSMRARVIYAAKDLELESFNYEDLADPEWQGRVCIRSGQHPYNTALFAAYMTHHGAEDTEAWLTGVKNNLARPAAGGDRDVAKDIMGGICDIGIANSYYVGLMRSGAGGDEQRAWGDAIKIILPTFEDGGTQVNISGAAVARHAPNKDQAVALLEFLVSPEAQKIYAEANFEYPVLAGAEISPLISELGELTIDPLPLTEVVTNRREASAPVDKVGFDN